MASLYAAYEPTTCTGGGVVVGQQGIPPRALNGGLYTGEPFAKDAPWANVPVIPDVTYMVHHNLRSANPPPQALVHYPGTVRPGNNEPLYEGVKRIGGWNQNCGTEDASFVPRACTCQKCNMAKYAYL